jgi:apolipoprotein N-acyltransferase
VTGSSLLTVLSFPDFDLWFLAWISLAPLLIVVTRTVNSRKAFLAGWVWGTIFFYGTCWWLTYPMIRYAQFPAWLAYPLLLLPVIFIGLFPAAFCASLCRLTKRFGTKAFVLAPIIWVSFEWLRYVVTGQLWNAIGYSQAFHPLMIQSARWGGVYAVSFLILVVNVAVAILAIRETLVLPLLCLLLSAILLALTSNFFRPNCANCTDRRALNPIPTRRELDPKPVVVLVGIQPNVPMDIASDDSQMSKLLERHLNLTTTALGALNTHTSIGDLPRVVIWPESPMSFSYSRDPHLRQVVGDFARANHTSILLNSLEPGAHGGDQNSAVMVNEKGEMSARYDKIRLMPFGEYVPLPRWLPGASSVRAIVGEFTPGSSYTLMPLGALRAGVFICIEAAHPGIARNFTNAGADVLINISNDGYLGPTPVMRQHLANAVFRAVENNRDLIRVTNTGITAFIGAEGSVLDQTTGFHEEVRTWSVSSSGYGSTFYTRHGDVFVYGCALTTLGFVAASFMRRRLSEARP